MWGGCCGGGWWGGGHWVGVLINLVLVLIVGGGLIALALWAVRRFFFPGPWMGSVPTARVPTEDPKIILKARYARGEITREQYLDMLRDLEEREGG